MKTYTLEELTDQYIGKKGTKKREEFDNQLLVELLGSALKQARKERNLTQEQLGSLVGLRKAQISKIENSTMEVKFSTIVRVANAMNIKLNIYI